MGCQQAQKEGCASSLKSDATFSNSPGITLDTAVYGMDRFVLRSILCCTVLGMMDRAMEPKELGVQCCVKSVQKRFSYTSACMLNPSDVHTPIAARLSF